jgi:hypothetical protein
MAKEYTYALCYECPKCHGPVFFEINSSDPNLSESKKCALIEQTIVQCENPSCPLAGRAGVLRVADRNQGEWTV